MPSRLTRRDLLRFAGGGALGVLLSPLPWKLLDDTAIWTQNWPWIPEPIRGDITWGHSTCTLCGAGCGIQVRLAGKRTVGLSGIANHPMSRGTLCPTGRLAHHLPFHPSRILRPVRLLNGTTIEPTDAAGVLSAIGAALHSAPRGTDLPSIAIIDGRPGRSVSHLLAETANAWPSAIYIAASGTLQPATELVRQHLHSETPELSYDIAHARTILSFGAPLCDGWGAASVARQFLPTASSSGGHRPRLIQIEAVRSRTANFADTWIPVVPGSEHMCALAIIRAILDDRRVRTGVRKRAEDLEAFATLLHRLDPGDVSRRTGVPAEEFLRITRTFTDERPCVAVVHGSASPELQSAVLLLNLVAGTVFQEGGVRAIPDVPGTTRTHGPRSLDELDDHSLALLILDESVASVDIPARVLERKLVPGTGIVVSLSPFPAPRRVPVQYVLPAAVWGETLTDVTASNDAGEAGYGVSLPFLPQRAETLDTVGFVRTLAQLPGLAGMVVPSAEDLLRQRAAALHASGRGMVFEIASATRRSVQSFDTAEALWSVLQAGGCWFDGPMMPRAIPAFRFLRPGLSEALTAQITDSAHPSSGASGLSLVIVDTPLKREQYLESPLMSKLRQESALYPVPGAVSVHPSTARACDLSDGSEAMLSVFDATVRVRTWCDAAVPPGLVMAVTGDHPDLVARISAPGNTAPRMADAVSRSPVISVTLLKA